jgi:hypothetical protein
MEQKWHREDLFDLQTEPFLAHKTPQKTRFIGFSEVVAGGGIGQIALDFGSRILKVYR